MLAARSLGQMRVARAIDPLVEALQESRPPTEAALAPAPPGARKVVLATNVAETSLTVQGVRVVIDAGWSRVPRYDTGAGLTRLDTVRVSRASADQRRGRAGRVRARPVAGPPHGAAPRCTGIRVERGAGPT